MKIIQKIIKIVISYNNDEKINDHDKNNEYKKNK